MTIVPAELVANIQEYLQHDCIAHFTTHKKTARILLAEASDLIRTHTAKLGDVDLAMARQLRESMETNARLVKELENLRKLSPDAMLYLEIATTLAVRGYVNMANAEGISAILDMAERGKDAKSNS